MARRLILLSAAVAFLGGAVPAGAAPTVLGRSGGDAAVYAFFTDSECYWTYVLTGSISFASRTFNGTVRGTSDFNCWKEPYPPLELTGTSPEGDLYAT